MEGGGRDDKDSRGRDKAKTGFTTAGIGWWQRGLLAVLFLCGPIGTVISFVLLPKDGETTEIGSRYAPMASASVHGVANVRVLHLSLAESSRRARFVLDENTVWDTFLAGCRERLQVQHILKVTDSSGEAILAVEDLVHDDHLIIFESTMAAAVDASPPMPSADDLNPLHVLPPGLSDAPLVGATSESGKVGRRSKRSSSSINTRNSGDRSTGDQSSSGGGGFGDGGGSSSSNSSSSGDSSSIRKIKTRSTAILPASALEGETDPDAISRPGAVDGATYAAQVLAHATGSDGQAKSDAAHNEKHRAKNATDSSGIVASKAGVADSYAQGEQHEHLDDPLYDQENPSRPCGKRHPQFRIAMLIPWINDLPAWLSYFVATAQRAEYLIAWLIFHETLSPPRNMPSNVRFIDLGPGGLSQLIGLKMGEELGMPVRNASLLIRSMRFMLEKCAARLRFYSTSRTCLLTPLPLPPGPFIRWPRLVAEYKPAFGSVFEQYLGEEYTHWGYCDLDMVIGNLPLFIEHSELATQDIVSYSFGDNDAFYLRGQWTVHRNRHDVSTIWKACPHLGDELQKELLMKVAWVRRMESRGVKNYPKRFQSAEGCYSHRAAQLPGVRIKVAHKQFVGLSVPSDDVIFAVNGAVWQCPKSAGASVEELRKVSTQPCSADLPGVQEPLGDLLPLEVTADGGCGKWMPYEYRMCAPDIPEPPERERDTIGFNTFLKDGKFYAQRFRSTLPVLDNGCKQGSFFHMQEWKKIWGYGTHGVDPLELVFTRDTAPTFAVTTEGISLL
jgi:uncharacterized membrane protein YgcG